ncbi:MAG: formylglycine-generating enzyme family protein [Gammaproteobacteria bacterium]|nr:formylglycine-generating enzyme family protein [Gammaproteobacteria bacterium]
MPTVTPVSRPLTTYEGKKQLSQSFVHLPASVFRMGSEDKEVNTEDHEGPIREVKVDSFEIATTAVTNAQFSEFVRDTGYLTDAERIGWSFVFHLFYSNRRRKHVTTSIQVDAAPWWVAVDRACWRRPFGTGSNIRLLQKHPAVHVTWNDAKAFCSWAGCRLPTETEWEFAARGGLDQNRYPWGNELTPNSKHLCNIWQGEFPDSNTSADGYTGTAPVDAYEPNGYGLFNMAGNVWEWCEDWFGLNHQSAQFRTGKVLKGGSYLCHASYCNRYRVAARYANAPNASTGNCGFRVVIDESFLGPGTT